MGVIIDYIVAAVTFCISIVILAIVWIVMHAKGGGGVNLKFEGFWGKFQMNLEPPAKPQCGKTNCPLNERKKG